MKKALALALSLFLFPHISEAQKWTDMMRDTNANFYDIVKEFDAYWKGREVEKGKGYKAMVRGAKGLSFGQYAHGFPHLRPRKIC